MVSENKEIKDKIKTWQTKILALSKVYNTSSRSIEYILKGNFSQLDWRSLLTDEMLEFADKELLNRQLVAKQKGEDKYQAQKKYFRTKKGKQKLSEATNRYRKNAGSKRNDNSK